MDTLTISHLPHPLLSDGRQITKTTFVKSETLLELLKRSNLFWITQRPIAIFINGEQLVTEWENYQVNKNDIVTIRAIVQGENGNILAMIGMAVMTVAAPYMAPVIGAYFGAGATAIQVIEAGIVIGSSLIISSLVKPPISGLSNSKQAERYVIGETANQARKLQPLSLVIGEMRVFPDLSTQPYTTFRGDDQFLYQAFCFGLQPELDITSLRIGTADLGEYTDINVHWGDDSGQLPPEFGNVDTIQAAEVKHANAVTRSTQPSTIAIGLDFQVLAYDIDSGGNTHSQYIEITVEIFTSAASAQNLIKTLTYHLNGDGINTKRYSRRITGLPSATYTVVVTKVTEDVRTQKKVRQLNWVALKAFQEDNADYSNQKRLGIEARASGQLSGRLDKLNGIAKSKIPIWDGNKFILSYTQNPAWWLLWWYRGKRGHDNRRLFGGGLDDSRIDIEAIKRFASFCDRKDLTCNAIVNTNSSVKVIADMIARTGRGEPSWGSGSYGVIFDDDQLTHVAVFGPENMKENSFRIGWAAGKLADEVIINFKNADKNWEADSIRSTVVGILEPENPIEIDYMGCTNPIQAGKEAALLAAAQIYHRRRMYWSTDHEGLEVSKGDVVMLSHDMVSWSYSGRLMPGSDHFNLFLDSHVPPPTPGKQAVIGIRFPDGLYETYMVSAVVDNHISLRDGIPNDRHHLLPSQSDITASDFMWFYDEAATPGRLVKITDITPSGHNEFSFSAIDYSQDYYQSENNTVVHHPGYSKIRVNLGIPLRSRVIGLTIIEDRRSTRDGQRLPTAHASWVPLLGATYYIFKWKKQGNTSWHEVRSSVPDVIIDVEKGQYEAIVMAYNADGDTSPSELGTFTILDAAWPASDVYGLTASPVTTGILIKWDECKDIDYALTEIRIGDSFDTAQVITTVKGSSYVQHWLTSGRTRIWARNFNSSLPSENNTYFDLQIRPPKTVSITRNELQLNALSVGWSDSETDQPIKGYSIYIAHHNHPFSRAEYYGKAGADSRSDVIIFMAEAEYDVYIEAEDVGGNKSSPQKLFVSPSLPNNYTLAQTWSSLDHAVLTNALKMPYGVLMLINTAQSWKQHFSDNNFNTINDQINTGANQYFQPSTQTANLTEIHDFGKEINNTIITLNVTKEVSFGDPTVTVQISWSLDKVNWFDGPPNANKVAAKNVRYVKISITAARKHNFDVLHIQGVQVSMSLEDMLESGRLTLNAADTQGTPYHPHKKFLDIVSVTATPTNSPNISKLNTVISDSGPSPIVYVQAWDENSQRIGGEVSLNLGGY